ncbi:MAG: hypothetical protein A2275_07800 [Bacteroidetes bacterium RIFOXYA12_FULL_35_11]|nr:MAG: hypothetical protein A2X01_18295 [Bacteroidetes bacterium GWF2_35_48]OFY76429.1 MAG: hypothetical protein A2275_07800 [Bacteroidetes bacterium RIFOXYA12_FULL_35_11]OFY94428.1 MAG: hypothetical protein A2309_03170 [Bacteroidetes bacterium RIFOXYB2_FULL_35_7]HBX52424.1 endonuclease I [Bacteroidales bacterium]
MSKVLGFFLFLFFAVSSLFGQIPPGYYDSAEGLNGVALKNALHTIISSGTTSVSYTNLWTAFETTDKKLNGKVWDMYSDIPDGTPPYEFTFDTDQCGNYSGEGDCYNREHSFPSSWFNDNSPMYSDLFHLYPTDGYVNNKRSNYPFGEVGSASWTAQNGGKLGNSSFPGYTGVVFEPIDAYKGDFARSYLYMSVRYSTNFSSFSSPMISGGEYTTWAINLLLQWHQLDTVSQKEINRNNVVYGKQHNRNPFIDHPEWVNAIWGTSSVNEESSSYAAFHVFPNPASDVISISYSADFSESLLITITDLSGKVIWSKEANACNFQTEVETNNFSAGFYFASLSVDKKPLITRKIIILK